MGRNKASIYIVVINFCLIVYSRGSWSHRRLKDRVAEETDVSSDTTLTGSVSSTINLEQTVNMSDTFDNGKVNYTGKHRLSPAEEKNSDAFSTTAFTLNGGDSLLAQCGPGLWIPVYSNDSREKLELSVCLKIVILKTGEKYRGYILNSTSLSGTSIDISSNSSYITTRISFYSVYACFCGWSLNLLIEKRDGYYWKHLSLYYNLDGKVQYASNDNIYRYKAKIHGAYICMYEDTIKLDNGVFVLIKDLKYRVFTNSNNDFPDEDIAHCPSVFKEFAGIVAFTGSIIIATLSTIIWTSLRQVIRRKRQAVQYKLFGRRFEP